MTSDHSDNRAPRSLFAACALALALLGCASPQDLGAARLCALGDASRCEVIDASAEGIAAHEAVVTAPDGARR